MKKIFGIIFSAEFAFVLFLTAAYFKEGLDFIPETVDLTFVFFALTLILSIWNFVRLPKLIKGTPRAIYLYLWFVVVVLLSFFATDSIFYAQEKLIKVVVVMSWSFLGIFFIIRTKDSLIKFLKGFVVIATMMTVAGLIEFFKAVAGGYYVGKLIVFDMSYLALGRTVVLGMIFLACYSFFSDDLRNKKSSIMLLVLMGIAVVVSGARMPIISFVIIIFLFSLSKIKPVKGDVKVKKTTFILIVSSVITTMVILLMGLSGKFNVVLSRISLLFTGADESSFGRLERFDVATAMILQNPIIGQGFASFPLFYNGLDKKEYPHNIFLEIQAELGIIGTVIFVSLLAYAFYRGVIIYKRNFEKLDYVQLSAIGLFIFFFLNSNTTGDITDNRILFAFMSMLIVSPFLIQKKIQ